MAADTPFAPPARWRASRLVAGSIALHAVLPLAWFTWPAAWGLWLGVLVADHLLLTACGLWPRSNWLGPNITRLPAAARSRGEVALTIDDGPDPDVTPAVLDILDAQGARATFFCIGTQAQRHPDLCREIVRRGHTVENHSMHHRHHFSFLGPRGFRRELQAAQDTLQAITGRRPRFVRAPAGLRNPFLDPVLPGLGLRLTAWTRRGFDTRTGEPDLLLRRLTRGLAAGDILLLHDGHGAAGPDGRAAILTVLPALLERIRVTGLRPVTLSQAFDEPTASTASTHA